MTQINVMAPDLLPRKPITSVGLTIALAVLVVPLVGMLVFVVPKYAQIFKDFHTELPAATAVLLYVSRCCANVYVAAGLLLVPVVVPILTTRLFWRPHAPRRSGKQFAIVALVVVCVYALITVALFAPMIALIQTVSSPQKH
jgi:type II secretory pathway component PulF